MTLNRRLVRREASKTALIITRAEAAAERLRAFGVNAPLEVTADNALTYCPDPADAGLLARAWPEAGQGVVGMALVDFGLWPVKIRPWGPKEDCYKWPYYFTTSPERQHATDELAGSYATLADCVVREHHRSVALICMEELDEPLARKVVHRMANADRVRVFSAREYNASQMTSLLRSLDLLMTSRYHACVLSLAAQVPQLAVGHDLRLRTIYDELGLTDQFFVEPQTPNLCAVLSERMSGLLANPAPQRESLRRGYEEHLHRARGNRDLLRWFVQDHGWEVAA